MIGSYQKEPPFAYPGWRLRIPGGPAGGQQHGGAMSDVHDTLFNPAAPGLPGPYSPPSPWDSVWGGVALKEGQSRSDYVYRSSAEMRPRANASGGINVVQAFQTKRSAGYAVAPGNYRGVGILPNSVACPMEIFGTQSSGCTNRVPQPSPPIGPGSGYVTEYSVPPVSPAPSPTVAAPANAYLPSQGQPLPGAAVTSPGIQAWLSESTIVSGVENLWIAGAAVAAAYFMFRSRK